MFSLITAGLLLLFFGCVTLVRRCTSHPTLRLPPGPRGLPLIGNAMAVMGRPFYTYARWQREHGNIFMVTFGPIRVVVLGSAKLIRECFSNPIFNGRPSEWSAIILTNGRNGLLTTEGPVWEDQRRFTARALRSFGFGKKSVIESQVMKEVVEFLTWLESNTGKSIEMKDKFELAITNALWGMLASQRFRHDDSDKLELLQNLYKTFGQPTVTAISLLVAPSLLRVAPRLLGYTAAVKLAQDFHAMLEIEIENHIENPPKDGVPRDYIDAYLQEIEATTDKTSSFYKQAGRKSLVATIAEFFFGATETTTLTLMWAMLYIVTHTEVQTKLQAEVDSVIDTDRYVSLADKPNMPYSEAVILEALRQSSIVTTGVMHCTMEDSNFHGYQIPKNTWIMSNLYAMHHQQEIWGDPHNFRPERFLSPDRKTVIKNPNLVPFSAGKRNCMGEQMAKDEIFLFLTNIFRKFKVVPDPSKSPPILLPMKGFLLRPEVYSVCATLRNRFQ